MLLEACAQFNNSTVASLPVGVPTRPGGIQASPAFHHACLLIPMMIYGYPLTAVDIYEVYEYLWGLLHVVPFHMGTQNGHTFGSIPLAPIQP